MHRNGDVPVVQWPEGGGEGAARLNLIGPFRLIDRNGDAIPLTSRRIRGLLAYLMFRPGQIATRSAICRLLWGDRGDAQARASLRQGLLEFHKTIGPLGLDLLIIEREDIALRPGSLSSDVADLQSLLSGEDSAELTTMLHTIGPAPLLENLDLDGAFGHWRDQTRIRLERSLATGVLDHLRRLEALGDWAGVRNLGDAFLVRDPLDEAVVTCVINAESALGAASRGHRRFRELRTALAQEFSTSSGALAGEAMGRLSMITRPQPGHDRLKPHPHSGTTSAHVGRAVEQHGLYLAVLPFENAMHDADLTYISDGVSEEILQLLARTPELNVIGRSSSFHFRGPLPPVGDLRRDLGASHVLSGSVSRAGDRITIAASLIETEDGMRLWGQTFDGGLADVFAIEEEIGRDVVKVLGLRRGSSPARPPIPPAAHDLYLRARSLAGALPSVDDCMRLLEEAVALAPDFAPAWASLAMARAMDARWLAPLGVFANERARALQTADHAAALDPKAGIPLVAKSLLEPPGQFAVRKALLDRAVLASPSDPEVLKHACDFACSVGRLQDGYDLIARAQRLDPLNPVIADNAAQILADRGLLADSYRAFEVARARWPKFSWLLSSPLLIAAHLGDWETADPLIEIARRDEETFRLVLLAVELLKSPLATVREQMLASVERQLAAAGYVELRTILFMYSRGLEDEAFDALSRSSFDYRTDALPERIFLVGVIFGATNAAMRRDPSFLDLCGYIGLCDYWASTEEWPDCLTEVAPYYDLAQGARAWVEGRPESRVQRLEQAEF
jgi:TolB-like protein/DNA-binding SARP family transcriptional activator/tetratricopeptide (TPR) repeat protein